MPSKLPDPTAPAYFIRESTVHGRGLYAARDLKCGDRVVEYLGEKITKAESERRAVALMDSAKKTGGGAVYMFILNKNYDIDGNVDYNDARLMNHTCEPNCEANIIRGRIWYVATKDIPAGHELGLNYGFAFENWEDHKCRCGTKSCVGYIVAEEFWPKLRRELAKNAAMGKHRKLLSRNAQRKK